MNTNSNMQAAARRDLAQRIERFLDALDREGRGPDLWEGEYVMQALAWLDERDFARGERAIIRAECPAEHRLPQEVASLKVSFDQPTTVALRINLERILTLLEA